MRSTDAFTCILLDLRKAFISINRETFSAKTEIYGVIGIRLNWFESVFKEQRQCVQLNDVLGDFLYLLRGVLHGSVLGPLLFLL